MGCDKTLTSEPYRAVMRLNGEDLTGCAYEGKPSAGEIHWEIRTSEEELAGCARSKR